MLFDCLSYIALLTTVAPQVSDTERYTADELKSDLEDCEARQVHVIIDQSYAGEIVRVFRRSTRHRNVVLYASGSDAEYSFGGEFTHAWTHRVNHTTLCTRDVFKVERRFRCRRRIV